MRSGSGTRLTEARLALRHRCRNWLLWRWPREIEVLDQHWHGQALNQDREGDDDEGRDDDGVPLHHCRRHGQSERESKRASQPTPEKRVLVGGRKTPARSAEGRRERVNGYGAASEHR